MAQLSLFKPYYIKKALRCAQIQHTFRKKGPETLGMFKVLRYQVPSYQTHLCCESLWKKNRPRERTRNSGPVTQVRYGSRKVYKVSMRQSNRHYGYRQINSVNCLVYIISLMWVWQSTVSRMQLLQHSLGFFYRIQLQILVLVETCHLLKVSDLSHDSRSYR